MIKIIPPYNRSHFSSVLTWIILHSNTFFHLKEEEVTVSPQFNAQNGIKSYSQPGGENSKIQSPGGEMNLNNLSREATELLIRLNELANEYPFNIIYRAKLNDPR